MTIGDKKNCINSYINTLTLVSGSVLIQLLALANSHVNIIKKASIEMLANLYEYEKTKGGTPQKMV